MTAPSDDQMRLAGRVFSDALRHANQTPQSAAYDMGFADQSKLSRWTSGVDLPAMLVRFIASPHLRRGLVIALAELPDDEIEAKTVITVGARKAVSA